MSEKESNRFNKVFPWFAGLSGDLLFWVAIDTLFLTVVKKFNASQIVSLTSISLITCILLQIPLLNIIKRIGNTKSVRFGSLLLLISSILLTFGTNYTIIVMGKILYEIAFTFQNMINAVLKNNLELQNRENEYIKFRTNANTIYAIVTMIISFVASIMFNINNYLPMIGCITFCFICFVLSLNMIDYSNNDCVKDKTFEKKKDKPKKINYSKIVLFIIISYGLFYPIVSSGQSNGKLFIQQELLKSFDVEKTSLIIGAILCVSRIIRVISNISFNKIHRKYKDKVGYVLPLLLSLSLCLMAVGYLISYSIILKILIMSFGYVIILFIRDPFKVYMQDLILKKSEKEQQQTLLTTLDLSRKVVRSIMSLCFTAILVNHPMIVVITILIILSVVEIFISLYLYRIIKEC
jgi:MFS family permease